jgi:hypothetical protein
MFKKLTLGAILTASCALADASIMSFDINQTFSQGVSLSDLSSTSINIGAAGYFDVDPGSSNNYFDFEFPGSGAFSVTSTEIDDYYFAETYATGDIIGLDNFGTLPSGADDWVTILVNDEVAETWGASHDGFLGFLTDDNLYGWIEYSFEYDAIAKQSTLSFLSGAFNDIAGESITIPGASTVEVSAPSSLAILGISLFSLGFSRKKKFAR